MTIGNKVRVNKTVEVEPLSFLYEGQEGIIIDVTCPNYAKVKAGYKVFWIDMKYLNKVND